MPTAEGGRITSRLMTPARGGTSSQDRLGAVYSLRADVTTAEVVDALAAAGVRAILLKGPGVAGWLYDSVSDRPYTDTDLLVAPEQLTAAARVLSQLGFERVVGYADQPGPLREQHAESWLRHRDSAVIDLHCTLRNVDASAQEVWAVLSAETDSLRVAGVKVEILSEPARALHVALHAAQHGARAERPLEDLARALDRVATPTWEAAALVAHRLQATAAFGTGLRLHPAGRRLVDDLGISKLRSVESELRATTPPAMTMGWERLARASGLRAKCHLLVRELFPSKAFMRVWSVRARSGRAGLAMAYAWRPFWLLLHAGPALRAWRRARRIAARDQVERDPTSA